MLVTDVTASVIPYEKLSNKFNFYSSEEVLVNFWVLLPDQEIVLHAHEGSENIYIVMKGEGLALELQNKEIEEEYLYKPSPIQVVIPPKKISIESENYKKYIIAEGSLIVVKKNSFHSIVNTGKESMYIVDILTPFRNQESIYTSR